MADEQEKTDRPEGVAPADPEDVVKKEEGETREAAPEIPAELPLLPVRDIVIFPYMTLPLFVGREGSIAAVDEALARDRYIFLSTQKDPSV